MDRRLFYLCLSVLLISLGCLGGGGGGGGGGLTGSGSTLGRIAGTVTTTGILASLGTASSPDLRAAMGYAQAIVYLEEAPNYSAVAGSNGTFLIENIPFGSYHVVARILSLTGTTYKLRTNFLLTLTPEAPQGSCSLAATEADKADRQIRVQIKNTSGISVPGCTVTLWGEAFTFEGNGIYLSPLFPAGAQGDVRVTPPALAGLQPLTISVNAGLFGSGPPLPVIGGTVIPVTVTNRAPVVYLSAVKDSVEGNESLALSATVYDPDGDTFVTSWTATLGAFSAVATQSATWVASARKGSATITLEAVETAFKVPKLSTKAQMVVNIASDAPIPGLAVDITGTATTQISGDVTADFIAVASFPASVLSGLQYTWAVSNGTPLSGTGSTFRWKSPPVGLGATVYATMSVLVTYPADPLYNASRTISIQVTPAPIATITAPVGLIFVSGPQTFVGSTTDFDGSPIPLGNVAWYLATGAQPLQFQLSGSLNFTYTFNRLGSYTIYFSSRNNQGISATASKRITIINATPTAIITAPANNTVWPIAQNITFTGEGNDFEDGIITTPGSLTWYDKPLLTSTSPIGIGPSITRSDLALGTHTITLQVVDSSRRAASTSIQIYVNASPTLAFTPADLAVAFGGRPVPFRGYGTNTAGLTLPDPSYVWYRNGVVFNSGAASFAAPVGSIPSGTHQFRLEVTDQFGYSSSETHRIAVGYPLATITAPASGLVALANTPINFTGTPDSTGTMQMEWWYDFHTPGAQRFGVGPAVTCATIPAGFRYISYIGTDSQGYVSSGTIRIRINQNVAMDILQPIDNGVYWGNQSLAFQGVGTETTTGNPVLPANMVWYRSEAPFFIPTVFRTATSAFVLSPNELGTGAIIFTLEGTGSTGATGSWTITVNAGTVLASVTAPASGTRVNLGETINLAGIPPTTPPLTMEWYRDFSVLLGNNTPLNAVPVPNGWHYFTYLGTDSQGVVSSSTIMVLAQNVPPMEIIPGSNSIFFGGSPPVLAITGSGTEVGSGIPVSPLTMQWYLDGAPGLWKSGSPITITPGDPSTGTHLLTLKGVDSLGAPGSITVAQYFGYPLATITAPASGSNFTTGSTVNFSASPSSSGTIVMNWYLDTSTLMGTGQNISYAVPDGQHLVSYIGTDSAGRVSRADIMVLLNNAPSMSFTPGNNSVLFGGQFFTLTGVGTQTIGGGPVNPATMKWYLDGNFVTPWKLGATPNVNVGDLATGWRNITLTGDDQFGVTGSVNNNLYYGMALATITAPASGSTYLPSTSINFTGTPDSFGVVTMEWYLDGTTLLGAGNNISSVIPDGLHTISYLGTDSYGTVSRADIQVLVENPPTMSFTPASFSIVFGNKPFTLAGAGTNYIGGGAVNPATMKWYLDGNFITPWKFGATPNVAAAEIATGNRAITLTGADQFGRVGTITNTIYYGFGNATIVSPASGSMFPRGSSVTFTGTPNSSGSVVMEWYLDGSTLMGSGSPISYSVPDGNHSITYIGTDSVGNVTSANIQILMNNAPTMSFTPTSNSIVFGGRSFTLVGSGTESISASPVDPLTMKWYLDGSFAAPWKTGGTPVVNPIDIATGNHLITLTGADSFGRVGTVTNSLFYGFSVATITSPASGSVYLLASSVSFIGSPNSSGTLIMEWYRNTTTYLAAGQNLTDTPPGGGYHTYTYVGTDSAGNVSQANIMILKDDPPAMSYTPASNSIIFGGRSFTLTGAGVNSVGGGAVNGTTMKWYLDGSFGAPWKTGGTTIITSADITTGTHLITLSGADQFGQIGTVTKSLYYGFSLASITAPASGSVYARGSTVVGAGTPDSSGTITMRWYLNNSTQIGTDFTFSNALPDGNNLISYIGTDSANNQSRADIQILMDDPPSIDFTPPDNSIIFTGHSFVMTGVGTQAIGLGPIATATMKWYLDGDFSSPWKTSSPVTVNNGELTTGLHQISLTGADQFGKINTSTHDIYFGYPLAQITSPASGTRFNRPGSTAFQGTPDSSGTQIIMEWYKEYLTAGATYHGNGSISAAIALTPAWNKITYLATDSTGYVSSHTIYILSDNPPTLTFKPVNNGAVFGGRIWNMTGSGTNDIGGGAISAATLKWYRDGDFSSVWKTGANPSVGIAELATGPHVITLTGEDQFGILGTATNNIYYGFSLASITYPASGTRFNNLSPVSFTGTPDSSGSITLEWYRDYLTGGSTYFGAGSSPAPYVVPYGEHLITYLATDAVDFVSSSTVRVLMNNLPTMKITPGNDSVFFGNHTVTLTGVGTDTLNASISTASMTWYRSGLAGVWKTGSPITVAPGELATGAYTIRLEGTDAYGTVGSVSQNMYFGYTLASITSPASGTRIETLSVATFTAVPPSPATFSLQWYSDYGTAGAVFLGVGTTLATNTLASGWREITYIGTDSAGFISSSSIMVRINQLPQFQPIAILQPTQYATNSQNLGIFLASGGYSIVFNATATDYETGGVMPAASISWYYPPGGPIVGTGNTLSRLFSPGSYTVQVIATDSFNDTRSATFTFWVWDVETYDYFNFAPPATPTANTNLLNPTAVVTDGISLFVADPGHQRVVKLFRITSGLDTIGDIGTMTAETDPASLTTNLRTLYMRGTRILTLEASAGGNSIKEFDGSLLYKPTGANFTKAFGVASNELRLPLGIAFDNDAIYIGDTNNNIVKKFDINTGNYYAETYSPVNAPRGLTLTNADTELFVTNSGLNYLSKFQSNLNSIVWDGSSATDTVGVVVGIGAPLRIYASNRSGNQIHVFQGTGGRLFSFGSGGTGLGQFQEPWGIAIIQNDLYIVERTGNRIHRIRTGSDIPW